jgi:hypothetical protein
MKFTFHKHGLYALTLALSLKVMPAFSDTSQQSLIAQNTPTTQFSSESSAKVSSHSTDFETEFIEIQLHHKKHGLSEQLNFAPVMMDMHKLVPYVSVETIFKQLLAFSTSCAAAQRTCNIISIPPRYSMTFNGNLLTVTIVDKDNPIKINQATTLTFKPNEMFFRDNQLWLRYDLMNKIFPLEGKWLMSDYRLLYSTDMSIYSIIQRKRHEENNQRLSQQAQAALQEEQLKKSKVIKADKHFSGGVKYQIIRNQGFNQASPSTTNANYSTIADIFGGTFRADGTYQVGQKGITEPAWIYSFLDTPHFHLLEFGDVSSDSSLFMSNVPLNNGVKFDLNQSSDTSLSFFYEGQALPGTEINVYRGSYLLNTFTVDNSARFTVTDPNAEPGDLYKIIYYFPDGSEKSKVVLYSPDADLLLHKNQWDVNLSSGQFYPETSNFGYLNASLVRYGLTNDITAGVGNYYVTLAANPGAQNFTYADLDDQVFPWLNLHYQHLLNDPGFAARGIVTYFQKNFLSAEYRQLDANSDILQIPTVTGDYAATKRFYIEDRYSLNSGIRLVSSYENSNIESLLQSGFNGRVTPWYSLGLLVGRYSTPTTAPTLNIEQTNNFNLNAKSTLQALVNWNATSKDTESLVYSYRNQTQNQIRTRFNYTVGATLQRTGLNNAYQVYGNAGWVINPFWQLGATANQSSVMLSLSFTNTLGMVSLFNQPDDFGGGTLSGTVYLPNDDGSPSTNPAVGALVSAGSRSAIVDENGHYTLTGLPSHYNIPIEIDLSELGLSYIPIEKDISLYFRPNTRIEYSPVIGLGAGLDGYIQSTEELPKGVKIIATASDPTRGIYEAHVEPIDGFFLFESIPSGTYTLSVLGMNEKITPKTIVIEPGQDWLGDVFLPTAAWSETKPQLPASDEAFPQ